MILMEKHRKENQDLERRLKEQTEARIMAEESIKELQSNNQHITEQLRNL